MSHRRKKANVAEAGQDRPTPRRWRRWARLSLRALVLLTLAFIAIHAWWAHRAARSLDSLVSSYKSAGAKIEPGDFAEPALAESENAVVELRRAVKAIDDSSPQYRAFMRTTVSPPLTSHGAEMVSTIVSDNWATLRHVDRAVERDGVAWGLRFESPVMRVGAVDLAAMGRVVELLRAAALAAHHEGDEMLALRRARQMLVVSRLVDRQPLLAAHVTAASLACIAARTACEIAPDLKIATPGATALVELIRDFADDQPIRAARIAALAEARMAMLDTTRQVLAGHVELLPRVPGQPPVRGGALGLYGLKPLLLEDSEMMLRFTTVAMDAAERAEDWPTMKANAPAVPQAIFTSPRMHLLSNAYLPDLTGYIRTDLRAITECRLAAVALAIGWYSDQHAQKPPPALEALVPRYLDALPNDPMAHNQPLRYAWRDKRPILYSVGDNGTDEGGSTAPSTTADTGLWAHRDVVVYLDRPAPTTKPSN